MFSPSHKLVCEIEGVFDKCSFYDVETLFWTTVLLIFIFFLVGVCGWACCGTCGCQRAAFKGEGSLPLVGYGAAAWAVRHAQRALLSAELSCWPPTLVFKSSSVLRYFGCWSQETEIYASFFYFFHPFGQCALKPFICSLFFLWAYAVLTCSWFLLPSVQNCVFLLVFWNSGFPLQESSRQASSTA